MEMEILLENLMQKKKELSQMKEELASLENEVFEKVKDVLSKDKNSTTIRYDNGIKLEIRRNPKFKLNGDVPEGIDVYKKVVDELKLKKYANEDWVMAYENKPTVSVVREF